MHRFLKSSRAEHQQEVSSVSGEVILSPRGDATFICPITGQPSLAPISVTRIAIGSILRWTFPLRGVMLLPVAHKIENNRKLDVELVLKAEPVSTKRTRRAAPR